MNKITHKGEVYEVATNDLIFLLTLRKLRRKAALNTLHAWENRGHFSQFPTFAESLRVEDLLPCTIVTETKWQPWRGTFQTSIKRFDLRYNATILVKGTLCVHFTYEVAASKASDVEECLKGNGWREISNA